MCVCMCIYANNNNRLKCLCKGRPDPVEPVCAVLGRVGGPVQETKAEDSVYTLTARDYP